MKCKEINSVLANYVELSYFGHVQVSFFDYPCVLNWFHPLKTIIMQLLKYSISPVAMEDRALKTPLDIFCSNFLTRFCPRYKDPLLEAKLGCHDAGAYESATSKISTSREWWGNIQARSKGSIYIHRVAPYNLAATCQNYPNTSSRHSIIFWD